MLPSPCIYIVDHDQAARDSLQWLLGSVGLDTKTYDDAQTFFEQAGKELLSATGCVVVEAQLPVTSGIELQQRLRLLGIKLPVIMVTGYGQVAEAVAAMKAGAVDYLEKPFTERDLLDQIQRTLNHQPTHAA